MGAGQGHADGINTAPPPANPHGPGQAQRQASVTLTRAEAAPIFAALDFAAAYPRPRTLREIPPRRQEKRGAA